MPTTLSSASLRTHWTLDPTIRYLNHGSFGATPKPVLEAQSELRSRMEREPVLFLHRELESLVDAAREPLARFVGARIEDLVPAVNATSAVNAVLRSLDFTSGDEILVTDHGYNACKNVIDYVASRTGARVVVARVPFPLAASDAVVAAIERELTPRTRFLLVDHVTSPTGIVLPIERIIALCRARGILVMIDGAHGPGMLELDVARLGADFYTGNCHKWMCAPKGAAFLHVAPEHQARLRPTVISHGANSPRTDRSRFRLEFDCLGTADPTAFLVVGKAIEFLGSLLPGGWTELRRSNRALALEGRALLLEALQIEAPAPEGMLGSLVSVPIGDPAPEETVDRIGVDAFQRELFERHRIEVPVMAWPRAGKRLLRISAQIYNSSEEYRALAEVLRQKRAASWPRSR